MEICSISFQFRGKNFKVVLAAQMQNIPIVFLKPQHLFILLPKVCQREIRERKNIKLCVRLFSYFDKWTHNSRNVLERRTISRDHEILTNNSFQTEWTEWTARLMRRSETRYEKTWSQMWLQFHRSWRKETLKNYSKICPLISLETEEWKSFTYAVHVFFVTLAFFFPAFFPRLSQTAFHSSKFTN